LRAAMTPNTTLGPRNLSHTPLSNADPTQHLDYVLYSYERFGEILVDGVACSQDDAGKNPFSFREPKRWRRNLGTKH
jgi:hypothetical protein